MLPDSDSIPFRKRAKKEGVFAGEAGLVPTQKLFGHSSVEKTGMQA